MAKEFGKVSREDILAAASDGLTLRLERVLPSPRAVVYRALTDPRQLTNWWGPLGFTVPTIEFDPCVGGRYRIEMQPPDGGRFHLSGGFLEVDPPAHLAYTFCWEPPDSDDRETVAAVSLRERDDGTEVLLTQGEFGTEARLAVHEQGWTESLERLRQLLLTPRTEYCASPDPSAGGNAGATERRETAADVGAIGITES